MEVSNSEINAAITTCLAKWKRQVKTAMVIGSVIIYFDKHDQKITENEIADRLYLQIETGDIIVYGDVKLWCRSEKKIEKTIAANSLGLAFILLSITYPTPRSFPRRRESSQSFAAWYWWRG